MHYSTKYLSPLGMITIACDEDNNITGLWLERQKYFASDVVDKLIIKNDLPIFNKIKDWLDRYFQGLKPNADEFLLKPEGSAFRLKVWQMLCEIPYGEVVTYNQIAKKIALKEGVAKMSARAVGNAVGHNPISIIIPCHRVIGANGNLTGYAGGLDRKRKLLDLEGVKLENRVKETTFCKRC